MKRIIIGPCGDSPLANYVLSTTHLFSLLHYYFDADTECDAKFVLIEWSSLFMVFWMFCFLFVCKLYIIMKACIVYVLIPILNAFVRDFFFRSCSWTIINLNFLFLLLKLWMFQHISRLHSRKRLEKTALVLFRAQWVVLEEPPAGLCSAS